MIEFFDRVLLQIDLQAPLSKANVLFRILAVDSIQLVPVYGIKTAAHKLDFRFGNFNLADRAAHDVMRLCFGDLALDGSARPE
jgi:hypothetical protein